MTFAEAVRELQDLLKRYSLHPLGPNDWQFVPAAPSRKLLPYPYAHFKISCSWWPEYFCQEFFAINIKKLAVTQEKITTTKRIADGSYVGTEQLLPIYNIYSVDGAPVTAETEIDKDVYAHMKNTIETYGKRLSEEEKRFRRYAQQLNLARGLIDCYVVVEQRGLFALSLVFEYSIQKMKALQICANDAAAEQRGEKILDGLALVLKGLSIQYARNPYDSAPYHPDEHLRTGSRITIYQETASLTDDAIAKVQQYLEKSQIPPKHAGLFAALTVILRHVVPDKNEDASLLRPGSPM